MTTYSYLHLGSDAEYKLQVGLFQNHNPTVIPVKNTSRTLQVYFDVALRSIQSLVS